MAATFARSLSNYKDQQAKVAKSKGEDVYRALMSASTLTQARQIVYGKKSKKPTHMGKGK